ncbi:MAG TPA: hypothetical protein VL127_03785 [Bryobacteraceae bacterium]|jgi:hypothetical protein|nr:hypothetical protein [Bryobacteraceae bacterium]
MTRRTQPMTRRMSIWIALLGPLSAAILRATDLASVQQEPKPERRNQLALETANSALDAARTAYQSNDLAATRASLDEAGAAVSLAYSSLKQTGKEARRDPKLFKRTELATRQMLRRIEGIAESMSFEDRSLIDKLREQVAAIHDNLLQDIMAKKK